MGDIGVRRSGGRGRFFLPERVSGVVVVVVMLSLERADSGVDEFVVGVWREVFRGGGVQTSLSER